MRRVCTLLLIFMHWCAPAFGQALIADLSSHIIAVNAGFQGAELVLFGSLDAPLTPTDEIVVVVNGAPASVRVREKIQHFGVWGVSKPVDFQTVPQFHAVLTAQSALEKIPLFIRASYRLGALYPDWPVSSELDADTQERFRSGLYTGMQQRGLYTVHPKKIHFLGDRLFRSTLQFPQHVPVGRYQVTVYLLRSGDVVAAQSTGLLVSKDGLGADVAWIAHRYPIANAFAAVVFAIGCGWIGHFLLRRAS